MGVGNEGFQKMQFLDSDDQLLRDTRGTMAARDVVQFVKFADFSALGP